ncbi:MAG: lysylphosphatidylglycerol synthase domain-containing protein [Bacteroidia bacterium]
MNAQTQKKIIKLFKTVLVAATFGFIIFKLFYTYKINELWEKFAQSNQNPNYLLLFFAVLFVVLNWGIEIVKWKKLISVYEHFSFSNASKSVLSGIALSIITPNQLGDFAGRVIHLKKFNKIKGSLVAIVGHTAQLMATLFAGVCGLFYISSTNIWFKQQYIKQAAMLFFIVFVIAIYLYVNLNKYTPKIDKLKYSDKVKDYLKVFNAYDKKALTEILILSFVRYVVFMFQYYFLLQFFGINVSFIASLACIGTIFFAQSVVPSFIFLDIGLRGASAIWILEQYSNNTIGILLSAYSLWMINMMLPAIAGLIIIFKTKFTINE